MTSNDLMNKLKKGNVLDNNNNNVLLKIEVFFLLPIAFIYSNWKKKELKCTYLKIEYHYL
jgi:hypothetical protein